VLLFSDYVVELKNNRIAFAAINARMGQQVFIDLSDVSLYKLPTSGLISLLLLF
jgi:hypothetical protein